MRTRHQDIPSAFLPAVFLLFSLSLCPLSLFSPSRLPYFTASLSLLTLFVLVFLFHFAIAIILSLSVDDMLLLLLLLWKRTVYRPGWGLSSSSAQPSTQPPSPPAPFFGTVGYIIGYLSIGLVFKTLVYLLMLLNLSLD